MIKDFLIGDTLDEGQFKLLEHLQGDGYRRLYLACRAADPEQLFLTSVVHSYRELPVERIRQELESPPLGTFELGFIGHFDIQGEDEGHRYSQEQRWAMMERVPMGTWLPKLTTRRLSMATAIQLGVSVGEILMSAGDRGVSMFHVRPDYIWASEQDGQLVATGLSTRYAQFFTYQSKQTSRIMFKRSYLPPKNDGATTSLTFSLALMIAEWCSGEFPFPDSWESAPSAALYEGRPSPLDLPRPLAQVLQRAFTADPARRPALAQFLAELKALRAEDLAT